MKIFARITAAVAVLLIICSLLLLTVTTLLQGPIAGCFSDIRQFMPEWLLTWKINVPWMAFLTCFMQILCIAPMIFLAGRKKGGIWIEIVLLALLLVGIPAFRCLVDTVDFFVKITDFYGLSLEDLTDIRLIWLERMLYDMGLYNYIVVAIMLIVYGIAFLFVEKRNEKRPFAIKKVEELDYRTAILMGCFQCLSLIPGTSRSGATILGGILLGVSRGAAAEFSFFMAIPTMLGASALKLLKFLLEGIQATSTEVMVLITGCVVSFLVSVLVIRALMEYVRKRSFAVFGVYRIILGALVLIYFLLS